MYLQLRILGALALGTVAFVALTSAQAPAKIGVVNFKSCFEGSKFGKQEQARFEQIKKQLETTIEAKEKELNELAPKFSDEYLDTLSPEAEAELKGKYQHLAEELSQFQNQYYGMLNQANYQIIHDVSDAVGKAAKKVAAKQGLDLTLNEEVCFSYNPSLDISKDVIAEMDLQFTQDSEKKPAEKK